MDLPADFVARIRSVYPDGAQWLDHLPALVQRAAERWGLEAIRPVPNLSYNFVAFARRNSSRNRRDAKGAKKASESTSAPSALRGEDVVLKLGPPNRELASEIAALRLYDGRGCCRLLDADEADYAFLLERLLPGKMLAELTDDREATSIGAEVMQRLWQRIPPPCDSPPVFREASPPEVPAKEKVTGSGGSRRGGFIHLSDWFAGLNELRPRFGGGTGPFPTALVERVEALLPELFADPLPPVLMHGDFHHFNVLSSGQGWLAIDPKGVIGPRGYECGPFLINPWDDFAGRPDPVALTQQRIAILSERLKLERRTILNWAVCHSLLSAWWDLDEGGGSNYSIRCGEIFLETRV